MATHPINEVLRHLRQTALPRQTASRSDGQLLEDYLRRRDETALTALVHRHGPLVWGVCRRILQNHHDAEDAFQATFLVLVRKAASITSRELLANWLFKVAHQTALKARATVARRKEREKQMANLPEPSVEEQDLWRDVQPLLDQEISRLPATYRSVILLCDLEGKSRREAAQQLGCPEGTVAGRLARARALLAKRLGQRGITLSGAALTAVLAEKAVSASVPTSVVFSTIKAANLFAAGEAAAGAISVKVVALSEGVLKAMFLTKLKNVSVVVLLLVALSGAAGLIYQGRASEKDTDPRSDQVAPQDRTERRADGKNAVPKTADKGEESLRQLEAEVQRLRAEVETLKKQLPQAPPAKAKDEKTVIKVYSVAGLIGTRKPSEEEEELERILEDIIELKENVGSICYLRSCGCLIVRQPPEVQKKFQELFEELRKAKEEQKKGEAEKGR